MNKIKIPKEFELFGQTIKVKYDKELIYRQSNSAESHMRFNEIIIQPDTEGISMNEDQKAKSFFHELLHQILDRLGYRELSENEFLVIAVGNLLHQALKTAKY